MPIRIRSARGHSSRPPARIGRTITPGDTSQTDTCAARMEMAIVITARTAARRRFRVMSCCFTWSANRCPARLMERGALRAAVERAGTFMTWAGYPQIVSVARGPRSIFPEENGWHPAGRAGYDSIMADPFPLRPVTADEYAGFRRVH